VIFQPHRFTRTRDLLEQFGAAFNDADTVSVLDIYRGQRSAHPPVSPVKRLAQAIKFVGDGRGTVSYLQSFAEAGGKFPRLPDPGDIGAYSRRRYAGPTSPMVLEQLKKKQTAVSTPQTRHRPDLTSIKNPVKAGLVDSPEKFPMAQAYFERQNRRAKVQIV